MRNIPIKGWTMWGIVILTLTLNLAIIKAANNNPVFLWLLTISISLLIMAVYSASRDNRSILSITKRFKSFTQRPQYELLSHSINLTSITKDDLRVSIGNDQCSKPYYASLLLIKPWEHFNYKFAQSELKRNESDTTGCITSNSLSTFNPSGAGPIWQIDATYKGCRTENGNFSSLAFKRIANSADVKMIVINLPTQVKTNYWTPSTFTRVTPIGAKEKPDLFSRSGYTTFRDAEGLLHFLESLRSLSKGKPVGIRLSIGDKKDFRKFCHAIRKTQIIPDFIVVTGSSGKTVLTHIDLLSYPEIPLYEALLFVSQTLQTYGLDEDVKLIAEGEVISGFDILKLLALGANSVCASSNYFDIPESNYNHKINSPNLNSNVYYKLMSELVQFMNIGGFRSIKDVTLSKFFRRLDVLHSSRYTQTDEQVLSSGSVKKMFYDKPNEIDSMDRRSQEKSSMQ